MVTTDLDCVPLDAGAGAPQVGISPAKAEPERTQVKVIVSKSRFMIWFLLIEGCDDAKSSTSLRIELPERVSCKGCDVGLTSTPFARTLTLT